MLTVDYDRLGLAAGDLVLDLGCGFGRHAYGALRLGARVVATDAARDELETVSGMFEAMVADDEAPPDGVATTTQADATHLPFASNSFDRVIASEVLEHIPDDLTALGELARVLRPGGTMAVTVPAWLPERVCWLLSDDYHAPAAEGGHIRIYTATELRAKLFSVGLVPDGSGRAHALHSPYWWLRCALGPGDDTATPVQAYHRLLVWDIEHQPTITRVLENTLNPLLGKSLVIYATKPVRPSEMGGDVTGSAPTTREAIGV